MKARRILIILAIFGFYLWPVFMWITLYIQRNNVNWSLPLWVGLGALTLLSWIIATGIWYYQTLKRPSMSKEVNMHKPLGSLDYVLLLAIIMSIMPVVGCNKAAKHELKLDKHLRKDGQHIHDYYIDVHYDSIYLWDADNGNLVGGCINKWDSPLDSLIEDDNQ